MRLGVGRGGRARDFKEPIRRNVSLRMRLTVTVGSIATSSGSNAYLTIFHLRGHTAARLGRRVFMLDERMLREVDQAIDRSREKGIKGRVAVGVAETSNFLVHFFC